jgi:hypothetical protein
MRLAITVVLVGLMLGGCNFVGSEQPLFGHADAVGAPALRPGIWVVDEPDGQCQPNYSKPVGRWKDCAQWFLVREGDIASIDGDDTWTTTSFIIASGAPAVLQIGPDADRLYFYLGLRPLLRDKDGRTTGFMAFYALCGPPNPKHEARDGKDELKPTSLDPLQLPATLTPLPGLAFSEDRQNCLASDSAAVRRAVAFADEHPEWGMRYTAHRLRDVRPDDFAGQR